VQRIVIDTDGGVDDALALFLALSWPDTHVEAVTTVHGNVPVETATRNVREVLHLAGREVDLAEGRATPLTTLFSKSSTPVSAPHVHGRDGLGGWIHTAPLGAAPPAAISASKAIAARARQFPGEVTLITIGPLTNAAVALREDPEGFRLLKRIVTMGGAVRERGNVTATAEFNFFADPRAAREIVHSGVPLKLVSLDATHQVAFTRERLDRELGNRFDMRARFLRCICEQMFSFYAPLLGQDIFYLHDPLAAAVALDPSLAETQPMSIDIETKGELTRGMVVLDRRPWIQKEVNAHVCVNVDAGRFLDVFCERAIRAGR
jgi:purine nucleosidase